MKIVADFWLRPLIVPVNTNMLQAMAVHGALCLALRHPQFKGRSRQFVVDFTKSLGEWLVHAGALTPDQLVAAQQLEAEEGSKDLLQDEHIPPEELRRMYHDLF
jgi:hypothetical protein